MEYVQNLPLNKDFTVYSAKAMRQAMDYAAHHKLHIDIYYFPHKTLLPGLEYS